MGTPARGAVADIRPDPSLGDVPGTDDVLSLAASANLFSEGVTGEEASNAFGEASRSSAQSSGHSTEGNPIGAVIQRCRQREEEMDKMSGSSTPMILPAVLISLWMAACSAFVQPSQLFLSAR
ncbi:unnamed protein product [Gadus morhua 'NCC']